MVESLHVMLLKLVVYALICRLLWISCQFFLTTSLHPVTALVMVVKLTGVVSYFQTGLNLRAGANSEASSSPD